MFNHDGLVNLINLYVNRIGYPNLYREGLYNVMDRVDVAPYYRDMTTDHMDKVYGITGDESVAAMAGVVFIRNGFETTVYEEDDDWS